MLKRKLSGAIAALAIAAIGAMALPALASAHEGEFARFDNCPSTNPEVFKCIYSLTEGGEVVLGNKKVPIVNDVPLQGGFTKPNEETSISQFVGSTDGVTLKPVPQPVPGGLAGLVNCKEISDWFVRGACELTFENGLTGVNSTLELARPASEIEISESNLAGEIGLALKLPVKVHLENPFLGSECYIGSSSSPIIWNLTTGETSPPAPATPIHGSSGTATFLEGGRIGKLSNSILVDNAWAAPGANGCGGIFSFIINPIINAAVGVPAEAGHNKAVLEATSYVATAKAVNTH